MKPNQRILILTSGPACCNPRAHKEACALAAAGFQTTLLSPGGSPTQQALDAVLSQNGGYVRSALPSLRPFLARAITKLTRRLVPFGLNSVHSLGLHSRLLKAADAAPFDLCITHTEAPLWVGLQLLGQGRPVASDLEDWHSEDLLPEARRHRPLQLLRWIEAGVLKNSLYCSTSSETMAGHLHARHGGTRPAVITNSFPLQAKPDIGARQGEPSFFWFSQTIGPGRGLEYFLRAWNELTGDSRVTFLGTPQAGFPDALRASVSAKKRASLAFHGPVPPDELPSIIAHHDIGLSIEEPMMLNKRYTISNKLLQYLNAGLAVLASDTEGQREVLTKDPDTGLVVDIFNVDSVRKGAGELLADISRLRQRQAAARRLAETTYNWELESSTLLALVSKALDSRQRV